MDVLWLGHLFIMTNNKRHTHLQASGVFKSRQGGRRVGSDIWRQEAHASSPWLHREGETKQSPELGLACLLPVESPRKRQEVPGTYQRGPPMQGLGRRSSGPTQGPKAGGQSWGRAAPRATSGLLRPGIETCVGWARARPHGNTVPVLPQKESPQSKAGGGSLKLPQFTVFMAPEQMTKQQNCKWKPQGLWELLRMTRVGLLGSLVHRTATTQHSTSAKTSKKALFFWLVLPA